MFFVVVYPLPGFTQSGKVLTLNDISYLIKNGVSPNRIAQLVEEHGVGFELDNRAMRRLKQDGANEAVLSAVERMSVRYTEERQQLTRQQEEEARRGREEEAKRREEEKRRADEEKRRQPSKIKDADVKKIVSVVTEWLSAYLNLSQQPSVWFLFTTVGVVTLGLGFWLLRKSHSDNAPKEREVVQPEEDIVTPVPSDLTVIQEAPPKVALESAKASGENLLLGSGDATIIFQNSQEAQPSQLPKVALTIMHCDDSSLVGKKVPLTHFPFGVGRANTDLTIPNDLALSRQHVVIDYQPGEFTIRDLQTKNGTYVNGARLPSDRAHSLLFGTSIRLSNATMIAFILDEWEDLPDLTGKLLDNRYRLTQVLHASSKAVVYKAQDERFPHNLAVKVLSPKLAAYSGYTDEFSREAKTAASLQHPYICKVIDFGETNVERHDNQVVRVSYLCMDLMKGGNLSDRLKENYEPPLVKLIEWVHKLGAALDYAHRQGVIHSGIKPSCVVFDDEGNPYLTDFATASKSGDTSNRVVVGAPAFLAPEQWDGLDPVPATDQYSFGVLLYLLVTGSRPYEGQENPDVRQRNFARGPIPAHEQAFRNGRNGIPPAISQVLARSMATNPPDRYPFMGEFARNFEFAGTSISGQTNVFVSYHRTRSAGWAVLFARELKAHHNISVFVDTERQDSAIRFPDRLCRAIERCDVFVCFLADETLDSGWVKEEIRIAYENQKPMIPVFQESYPHSQAGEGLGPHIEALLAYDGVHLLDKRNIYVDQAIENVAQIVKKTVAR